MSGQPGVAGWPMARLCYASAAIPERGPGNLRIAMIGGGYVGLVSGACFAEFGVEVAVVESDPQRLALLLEGRIPIYEPGLEALVANNLAAGRLRFGADGKAAVDGAEAIFIA
ncbi:MAG: NAD-binding protein, partial [Acetobacteraceae bacterium]